MNLTHDQIEDIVGASDPKCPKCKEKLEVRFHERDSTSDRARCSNKACRWYAGTGHDGEWSGLEYDS